MNALEASGQWPLEIPPERACYVFLVTCPVSPAATPAHHPALPPTLGGQQSHRATTGNKPAGTVSSQFARLKRLPGQPASFSSASSKGSSPKNAKTFLFSHTEWDQWVGLSTCRHQWEIKANEARWSRPKRKKELESTLPPQLQTWPGLLRGLCGNNPNGKVTPPQESQGEKG